MQQCVFIPWQCVGSERRPGGRPAEMLGEGMREEDGGGGGGSGGGGGDRMIAEGEVEVGEPLGRGGQGSAFRGRWRGREGPVAIKRLDADMSGVAAGSEGAVLERGLEELRRMAAATEGSRHVCP